MQQADLVRALHGRYGCAKHPAKTIGFLLKGDTLFKQLPHAQNNMLADEKLVRLIKTAQGQQQPRLA